MIPEHLQLFWLDRGGEKDETMQLDLITIRDKSVNEDVLHCQIYRQKKHVGHI